MTTAVYHEIRGFDNIVLKDAVLKVDNGVGHTISTSNSIGWAEYQAFLQNGGEVVTSTLFEAIDETPNYFLPLGK